MASNKPVISNDNFLEALRGLSSGAASEAKIQVKKAIFEDVPQMLGLQDLTPGKEENIAPQQPAKVENRLIQERTIYLQNEQQIKSQIVAIQEEIRIMAKSIGELGKEVQVATMQSVVNPGNYHRNFFETLRNLIQTLRLKVTESRNWVAASNARAKQKKGYWAQAKTSGTKFTLSSERYMVTSTG
ncbi:MAG: DUF5660 family protein [Patescibacteria group bacterium]